MQTLSLSFLKGLPIRLATLASSYDSLLGKKGAERVLSGSVRLAYEGVQGTGQAHADRQRETVLHPGQRAQSRGFKHPNMEVVGPAYYTYSCFWDLIPSSFLGSKGFSFSPNCYTFFGN